MKKYIFTESQITKVIDNIVMEKNVLKESHEVYNLAGLAELLARTGNDEETLLEILKDVYKADGDEGVIKLFKAASGSDIKNVGNGRYIFRLT
jgi:hypothetical protein